MFFANSPPAKPPCPTCLAAVPAMSPWPSTRCWATNTLNFVAGRLSERIGRKKVLFIGWLATVPMPFMILYAPSWNWIVAATVLLGINQGLTWSMTQTSKLDLATADQRGLTIGLNEFASYFGVAVARVVTGYLATAFGPREGLMLFGVAVIGVAVIGAAGLLTLM